MSENQQAFKTEQEEFWAGNFGTDYINRNEGELLLASNLNFFARSLRQSGRPESCIELGANIGMNLRALRLLHPACNMTGVEINAEAAGILQEFLGKDRVFQGSIFDFAPSSTYDLVLIKGVLIHINPDMLPHVYDKMYKLAKRDILICEYYNPSPVTIPYRGHQDRLFKRDFAGEFMDRFSDTRLVDYGFAYRRDPAFPQDDVTWFLIRKEG